MKAKSESEIPVRVVGIGSGQGCDSIGWLACERLISDGWTENYPEGLLEVTACAVPVQLPAMLRGTRLLVILDALLAGGEPGDLHVLQEDDIDTATYPVGSHGIDVAQALALAHALYGSALRVAILGICTGSKAPDEQSGVEDLLDRAWQAIQAGLEDIVEGYMNQ